MTKSNIFRVFSRNLMGGYRECLQFHQSVRHKLSYKFMLKALFSFVLLLILPFCTAGIISYLEVLNAIDDGH